MIVYDAQRRPVELGEIAGRGGEATVYRVVGQANRLAKIYEPAPRPNYTGKLGWMVRYPPENPTERLEHASLAWPGGLLFDSKRQLKGYWMPYIQRAVPILDVFNPRRRAEVLPDFDRRYLLRTARNLAAALSALHRSGYVAGDINESNVLVTPTALVTLIDTDSFQVSEEHQGNLVVHPCPVGKPEYIPPELQGQALAEVVRQPDHDAFALAVLVFQLLMDGSHPFRAQWLADGDPPPLEVRIANGAYPYVETPPYPVRPPKNTLGIETLHP
jgi:DNA-binding helix-hairpin-helix protein with protein kinase domain